LKKGNEFWYMQSPGIRDFGVRRYSSEDRVNSDLDQLAVEEPLEIMLCFRRRSMLVHKPISITMRTPGQDQELAIGFLYTEGILHRRSDIEVIERGSDSSVSVTVAGDLDLSRLDRHFYTSSSCGICGKTSLQALRMNREIHLDPSRPKHSVEFLLQTPSLVREKQSIFEHTGGLHGAALFDQEQNLVRICEDIGRHNAVDKLVGAELLSGRSDFSDLLLFVSGRAGFELVQKSIMTGIPFMVAVGAPSSLSVELARQWALHRVFRSNSLGSTARLWLDFCASGDLICTLDRSVCCKRRLQPLPFFNEVNPKRQRLEPSLTIGFMRLLILLFSTALPLLSFADDVPLESLPQAVRETIDTEKGDGVVRSADSYGWGNVTIFRVEIDVDGIPDLELQIAGNGKLIRIDRLRDEKDDNEKDDGVSE
jgi:FdhD protein